LEDFAAAVVAGVSRLRSQNYSRRSGHRDDSAGVVADVAKDVDAATAVAENLDVASL
jgi:hypothetical protein